MTEEKNQIENTQTKVELQIIPCEKSVALNSQNVKVLNHESQDDPCTGKIILTVTCNGVKLTKADAGYNAELTHEIWASAKITKADASRLPDIDVSIHERCGAKVTKADAGKI